LRNPGKMEQKCETPSDKPRTRFTPRYPPDLACTRRWDAARLTLALDAAWHRLGAGRWLVGGWTLAGRWLDAGWHRPDAISRGIRLTPRL
jgi:hypothetical protein